ncbi:MAG: 4Fe-4S dicluster domain-containing protein [Thermodesulfobacteriota bacterium]
MKVFVIDLSVCNGCYNCQIACKDEHVANDWTPYSKPQPDTGQFWIRVEELVRGTVPKVMITYIPKLCMHCDEAPCAASCRAGAIMKREDGLVVIDPLRCTGCQLCVDTCPHNAVFFNADLNIAQKCTGCAHLLDNDDELKVPRCVDACPTEAIKFGEESEMKEMSEGTHLLNPEARTKSRVYYMNLPTRWVAGTIYDPVEKEVIIGAKCTLTDKESGHEFTVMTDNFGDFWLRGLKDNRTFSLQIEKDTRVKLIDHISTQVDVNLGDLPLE